MITISKNSMFYRFLDEGWLSSDERVPENLCPFMRKVIFYTFMYSVIYSIGAAALVFVLAPVINFFLPGFFSAPTVFFGSVIWVGIISLAIKLFIEARFEDPWDKLHSIGSIRTTASWLQAIHDKMCPEVRFK